jgi:hypothetical protein
MKPICSRRPKRFDPDARHQPKWPSACRSTAVAVGDEPDGDEAAIVRAAELLSSNATHRTIDVWSGGRRIAEVGAEQLNTPSAARDPQL